MSDFRDLFRQIELMDVMAEDISRNGFESPTTLSDEQSPPAIQVEWRIGGKQVAHAFPYRKRVLGAICDWRCPTPVHLQHLRTDDDRMCVHPGQLVLPSAQRCRTCTRLLKMDTRGMLVVHHFFGDQYEIW